MKLRADMMNFFRKPSQWANKLDSNNFLENLCLRALQVVQAICYIVAAPFFLLASLFDTFVNMFEGCGDNFTASAKDIYRGPWNLLTTMPLMSLASATACGT